MTKLIKRIEETSETTNYYGERLLSTPKSGNYLKTDNPSSFQNAHSDDFNHEQTDAICSALTNDLTFIWGPPGTGKTHVIGEIINQAYNRTGEGIGDSILLLSHTNSAVDNALEKVAKTIKEKSKRKCDSGDYEHTSFPVLRLGTRGTIQEKYPETSLNSHLERSANEINQELKDLGELLKQKSQKRDLLQRDLLLHEWANNSNIDVLESYDLVIEELEKELESADKEHTRMENKLHSLRIAYPEIEEVLSASAELQELEGQIQHLKTEKRLTERKLEKASASVSEATKQIKAFKSYRSAVDELMELPTLQELADKRELLERDRTEIDDQLSMIDNELSTLTEERATFFRANGQPKLFASRKKISENEASIENCKKKNSKLKRKQNSLQSEIEKLNSTSKRIKKLTLQRESQILKNDYNYWLEQRSAAKKEQSTEKKTLERIENQYETLNKKADSLKSIINSHSKHLQYYNELLESAASLDQTVADINNKRQSTINEKERFSANFLESYNTFFQKKETAINDSIITHVNELKNQLTEEEAQNIRDEINDIKIEISSINASIGALERRKETLKADVILNAKIIGTTLAKAYVDDTIQSRKFDTVIIDEVSMASIPALWCVSLLVAKHLVVVGDFLQLPPIVVSDNDMAKKWLGTDIFLSSEASNCFKKGVESPENCIALTKQFRMEKAIADTANRYYGSYRPLESDDNSDDRKESRKAFKEWYPYNDNEPIHIIDTSKLHAWVTSVPRGRKGSSRVNFFSASFVVSFAFKLLEKYYEQGDSDSSTDDDKTKVLIVSPYKPHTERINDLIKLEAESKGRPSATELIKAGTIHSFQGQEADIVLFDFVVDEPHWKANLFLGKTETDKDNSIRKEQEKMFNVAVTRAKFRLFLIGNIKFLRAHAKENALGGLLGYLLDECKIKPTDADILIPDLVYVPENYIANDKIDATHLVCLHSTFYDLLNKDLANAKDYVIFYSPFMTTARVSKILPALCDAINRGIKIAVITKALENKMSKADKLNYIKCEKILEKNGITVFHKKGMHEKHVFIDDHITWTGSLNPLSYSNKTTEDMVRTDSKAYFDNFKQLLQLDQYLKMTDDDTESHCPVCGGELVQHDGSYGVFWKCSSCGFTSNTDQVYPTDGLLRCEKCGGTLSFSMKNEPRWKCETGKHHQKIRLNDLRLTKMKALIPKDKLSLVEEYFNKSETKKKSSTRIGDLLTQDELVELKRSVDSADIASLLKTEGERQISMFGTDGDNKTDPKQSQQLSITDILNGTPEDDPSPNKTSVKENNDTSDSNEEISISDVFSDIKYRHFVMFCMDNGMRTIEDAYDLLLDDTDALLSIPGMTMQTANEIIDMIEDICLSSC